jgi:hypothetical protein
MADKGYEQDLRQATRKGKRLGRGCTPNAPPAVSLNHWVHGRQQGQNSGVPRRWQA